MKKKEARKSEARRELSKYQHKTTRTFVKRLRLLTSFSEARELYPKVASMLDKLAKRGVIHKKKAANQKSTLAKHVNTLAKA